MHGLFLLQLKNLEHLELAQVVEMTDSLAIDIARHCKRLKTVNLSLCKAITDKTVEYLAKHCKLLQRLHLVSCLITDKGMNDMICPCCIHTWPFLITPGAEMAPTTFYLSKLQQILPPWNGTALLLWKTVEKRHFWELRAHFCCWSFTSLSIKLQEAKQ